MDSISSSRTPAANGSTDERARWPSQASVAIATTKNTAAPQRHGPFAPPSASSIHRKNGVAMMRATVMMFGAFQLLGRAAVGSGSVMSRA